MTNLNGIGIHILYDAIGTDQENGVLVDFLDKARPAVINVMGAAKLGQAFTLAKVLQGRYPGMRVIFRLWPDDGRWKYQSPENWIIMAKPFLEAGLTVLVDNESTMDDYSPYVNWTVRIMDICTLNGWKVAVGRQPTGNPGDGRGMSIYQYDQFLPIYQALVRGRGLHVLSPNEYQAHDIFPGKSDGNTARYRLHKDEAFKHDIIIPEISIGEYGVAYHSGGLNPGRGWQSSGWDGYAYGQAIVNNFRAFYQPMNVSVAIYCWGDSLGRDWQSFRIDQDKEVQRAITEAALAGKLSINPAYVPPIIVPPPSPSRERTVHLPPGNTYVNIRRGASTKQLVIGVLREGDRVTILGDALDTSGNLWYSLQFGNIQGWTSTQGPVGKPRILFVA